MSFGLQIFDTSGNKTLDTSTRVGSILGTVVAGTINGSVTNYQFSGGVPVYLVRPLTTYLTVQPTIYFSGSTMYWDWGTTPAGSRNSCLIIYGVA